MIWDLAGATATTSAKAIDGARSGAGAREKLTAMKKRKSLTNAMSTKVRTRMVLTPVRARTIARVIGGAPVTAGAKANPTAVEQ